MKTELLKQLIEDPSCNKPTKIFNSSSLFADSLSPNHDKGCAPSRTLLLLPVPPAETFWLWGCCCRGAAACLFVNCRCSAACGALCYYYFYSFLALDSRSVVLFSCLPSRFAQENASVARHESAHLPRPPLPLLLAHGKHKPNSFFILTKHLLSPLQQQFTFFF